MERLLDKVAIVTGSGSGIGAATAKKFAEEGAKIILADISEDGVKNIKEEIVSAGGEAEYIVGDISDEDSGKNISDFAVETYGRLDILANVAGYSGPSDPAEQYNTDELVKIYEINVFGMFYMIKHAVPHLQKNGGSIINVGSNSALMLTDYPGYASSKGAVRTMSKTFAGMLAKDGIRVNTLIPGTTRTPMVQSIFDDEALAEKYISTIPLGKAIEAEDLANGALYLASDESRNVTGTELVVDGGMSL